MVPIKKVLILDPNLPTLGGGEKYLAHFCYFLEKYLDGNVQIDIMLYNHGHFGDVYAEGYVTVDDLMERFNIKLNCTSVKKTEINPTENLKEKFKNWHKVERLAKGYDLFVNLMYMSRHRGRARRNIYVCMFPPYRLWPGTSSLIRRVIDRYYKGAFFRSYDSFINISQFTRYWLETYWKKSKKSTIIYPPVFSSESIADRYAESKKANIIISVGRFFPDSHSKKQPEMVQFFLNNEDRLGDYEYHVIGAVTAIEEHVAYLQQVKELAGQSKRIFIHENCSYDELVDLYTRAKIFWHATGYGVDENDTPQLTEHFGITTVEAMSYGVVPVVINKGGQPEIVDEDINGYLWDTEDRCISQTCLLVGDEQKRAGMASNAAGKAKQFSTEAFYQRCAEVLNELQI